MTTSADMPDPLLGLRAKLAKIQADIYTPLNEMAKSNITVNPVMIETERLREALGPTIVALQANTELQDQLRGIFEVIRQARSGSRTAQQEWVQSLLQARDIHDSYLKEVDLPAEVAVGGVQSLSTEAIDAEVTFALESLTDEAVDADDKFVSPLGLTRRDWELICWGGASSEAVGITAHASPHIPLVIFVVLAVLLTVSDKRV